MNDLTYENTLTLFLGGQVLAMWDKIEDVNISSYPPGIYAKGLPHVHKDIHKTYTRMFITSILIAKKSKV